MRVWHAVAAIFAALFSAAVAIVLFTSQYEPDTGWDLEFVGCDEAGDAANAALTGLYLLDIAVAVAGLVVPFGGGVRLRWWLLSPGVNFLLYVPWYLIWVGNCAG